MDFEVGTSLVGARAACMTRAACEPDSAAQEQQMPREEKNACDALQLAIDRM